MRFIHTYLDGPPISHTGREMVAVVLDPSFGFDLAKMFDERTTAPAAAARGGRAEMLEALQSRIPKWSENASVELLLQSPDLGQCGDVQGKYSYGNQKRAMSAWTCLHLNMFVIRRPSICPLLTPSVHSGASALS